MITCLRCNQTYISVHWCRAPEFAREYTAANPPPRSTLSLATLDPALLAALRASRHINGTGPRSWRLAGHSWRARWWLPTPGGQRAAEAHDLAYLIGGTDDDRFEADRIYYNALLDHADELWFGARWLLYAEAELFLAFLKLEGGKHWHHGAQRDEAALWRLVRAADLPKIAAQGR